MNSPNVKEKFLDVQNQGIHNYSRQVARYKKRLETTQQGDVGTAFLEKLHLNGLEDGRIIVYAARLQLILGLFNKNKTNLADATKSDCERVLFAILNTKTNKGGPTGWMTIETTGNQELFAYIYVGDEITNIQRQLR